MPQTLVMPVVFVLCVVGSFAIASRFSTSTSCSASASSGFFLRQLNYPMAPLVLGIVLGDLLDKNLRRGLRFRDGDLLAVLHPADQLHDVLSWSPGLILMNVPAFTNAVSRLWAAATAPLAPVSRARHLSTRGA